MALLKFNSQEECTWFAYLLESMFANQGWADVKYYSQGYMCHICGGTDRVKRGYIAVNTYFEKSELFGGEGKRFVLWQLCINCHTEKWMVSSCFNNSIRYSRITCVGGRSEKQIEERTVENQPIFRYPLVVGLNTDSLIIS